MQHDDAACISLRNYTPRPDVDHHCHDLGRAMALLLRDDDEAFIC
jgi:hypothetical protein